MAKFKIKYVKNIFCPKHHRGNDWAEPMTLDYELGTNYTDNLSTYMYNQNRISLLCADFMDHDPRRYCKDAKFTVTEASVLLLKMIEHNLKRARQEKKRLDNLTKSQENPMTYYAKKVNDRELTFSIRQAKLWRKKVRDIKKSKEYMWEQLAK